MDNVNQYNSEKFQTEFKNDPIYHRLINDFEHLVFDWAWPFCVGTPREEAGRPSYFSVVPFYYLKFLVDQNPQTIYDLGCGWNIFKKYIPNIFGIACEPPNVAYNYGDSTDFVDDDYVKNHQNYFESVFAINSLHFHPLSQLPKIITDFTSMIAPDGHGFLALNLARMKERDVKFIAYTDSAIENFVRTSIPVIPNIEYQVVDIDLSIPNEFMNGNIRIVCHKTT